jgi:hypothetical protein
MVLANRGLRDVTSVLRVMLAHASLY